MTDAEYLEMIYNIIIPGNSSSLEKASLYKPYIDYINSEMPNHLYRYRPCSDLAIDAFEKDQLWFSTAESMNDSFDARIAFDPSIIKSGIKELIANIPSLIPAIGDGHDFPESIQNFLSQEGQRYIREICQKMSFSDINNFSSKLDSILDIEVNKYQAIIPSLIQSSKGLKIACFSEKIDLEPMWGHYADSSRGFALAYDFRFGRYSTCQECGKDSVSCPSYKDCNLYRVAYNNQRLDATSYGNWLIQRQILKDISFINQVSVDESFLSDILPCPDEFMLTKIMISKSTAWQSELEWRMICHCSCSSFLAENFSFVQKVPSAVYLGRRISSADEKILCDIAHKKGLPVYKMDFDDSGLSYNLKPQLLMS